MKNIKYINSAIESHYPQPNLIKLSNQKDNILQFYKLIVRTKIFLFSTYFVSSLDTNTLHYIMQNMNILFNY